MSPKVKKFKGAVRILAMLPIIRLTKASTTDTIIATQKLPTITPGIIYAAISTAIAESTNSIITFIKK